MRCIAWRKNYGRSYSPGAERCPFNANPGSKFCTHHQHLAAYARGIAWTGEEK